MTLLPRAKKEKINQIQFDARVALVQSLNSPFFPPHVGAEPGRAKRRVQDNLHAHARNEPIKNYEAAVDKSLLAWTCRATSRNIFLSSRSEKNSLVKNKLVCVLCGMYSYRQRLRVITHFPNIFWYFFCKLSEFVKGFERKVRRVQVA